jgi:hypothetical protein
VFSFNLTSQFVSFFAILAVASAGVIQQQVYQPAYQPALIQKAEYAPVAYAQPATVVKKIVDDYDYSPQYAYSYNINDALTGDQKSQHETREGDVVKGQYSLVDADGKLRTVDYTADPIHGFNAVVSRQDIGHKVIAQPAAIIKSAPVAYQAAPIAYQSAPIAYQSAPIVKTVAAAPAYYQSAPIVKTVAAAPAYYQSAPIVKTVAAAPAYYQSAPIVKTVAAAPAYYQSAPIVKTVAAAPAYYQSAPIVKTVAAAPAYYQASPAYNQYHH